MRLSECKEHDSPLFHPEPQFITPAAHPEKQEIRLKRQILLRSTEDSKLRNAILADADKRKKYFIHLICFLIIFTSTTNESKCIETIPDSCASKTILRTLNSEICRKVFLFALYFILLSYLIHIFNAFQDCFKK